MTNDKVLTGLVTADEACKRWRIHRTTLLSWLRKGFIPGTREPIPFMRVGRRLMFSEAQILHIEQLMERNARHRRRAS